MYMLRRYARAVSLYHRRSTLHQRHPGDAPAPRSREPDRQPREEQTVTKSAASR